MATLTEKESTVTYGNIKAELLAEYHNGKTDKITASITVDGYCVSWSLSHNHGEITLWDNYAGGFTQDWKIAVSLINTDFMLKLRKEIDKLVK